MALFAKHTDREFAQLVTERDKARALIAELEQRIVDAKGKLKAETDQRVAAEKQLAGLQAKLKIETDAKTAEVAKAKDLQEENDLLLAQLHQVQEELERYYLQNKDLEAAIGEATHTIRLTRHTLVSTLLEARGFVLPADERLENTPRSIAAASTSGRAPTKTRGVRQKLPQLPRPPAASQTRGRPTKKTAARPKKASARRAAK